MPVRMNKSWAPLEEASLVTVAAHLGVYQLANDAGEIVYIGGADARTLFGIKANYGMQSSIHRQPRRSSATKSTWLTARGTPNCCRLTCTITARCQWEIRISTPGCLADCGRLVKTKKRKTKWIWP